MEREGDLLDREYSWIGGVARVKTAQVMMKMMMQLGEIDAGPGRTLEACLHVV